MSDPWKPSPLLAMIPKVQRSELFNWVDDYKRTALPDHSIFVGPSWSCMPATVEPATEFRPARTYGPYCSAGNRGIKCRCGSWRENQDPGDEDDVTPERATARTLAGWRFRTGRTVVMYPARRLPPLPGHDPGDEQPRLEIVRPEP